MVRRGDGRRPLIGRRAAMAALGSAAWALACDDRAAPPGRRAAALWFSYGGRNREVLEALVARFNDSQTMHFVRPVFQGDYYEALAKLRTAVAARAGPGFSHVIGEVIPYLAEAGVLEALDDHPGSKELDVVPALGQAGSWIGGDQHPLVAIPFNRSTPIAYLNGAIFERAGLAAPKTWSELRETAKALTVRAADRTTRYGFECPISWWFWVAMVGQSGGQVVEPDGRVSLGDGAGVRALRLWQTMVHHDRSMRPPPGRDFNAWEAANQDYLAGRVAMIWTSTAFLKYLEDNAKFPVVAAPLPADRRAAVPTGGTHFVVMKDTSDEAKEASWAFLRWMLEPEQTIEWSTRTGYMPVTESAVARLERDGYYEKNPNDRVAYDQLEVAMPWPWSPRLFRIQREVVQPRLEGAVLEQRNAQVVLDAARAEAAKGTNG